VRIDGLRGTVCAGLVVLILAACGSGNKAKPASTATARSSPASVITRTVAFPRTIGTYVLRNPSTGAPAAAPTSDTSFTKTFPDAGTAEIAPYKLQGSRSASAVISVTAGQLKPGVTPTDAISLYSASLSAVLHRHGSAIADLVTLSTGSLGGQARCWVTLPFAGTTSTAFCMWADTSTYGVLAGGPQSGKDPTSALAKLLISFRNAMEEQH
jgi:hypothetical protein